MFAILDSTLFTWIILPVLIFIARVCDVSLGTIRVIFVSRGYRHLAPILGFFEISIWLFAIGQIMRDLTDISIYFAYAAGFATGTFVGIVLEEKLSLGTVLVRVVTGRDSTDLAEALRGEGYGTTTHAADGAQGPVTIVFTVVNREDLPQVVEIINRFNPRAFYSVEDDRHANEGIFPTREGGVLRSYLDPRRFFSKK